MIQLNLISFSDLILISFFDLILKSETSDFFIYKHSNLIIELYILQRY